MSNKNEHTQTPRPWYCGAPEGKRDTTIYALTPVHKNPRSIARVYGQGLDMVGEYGGNAELIVRAVNAHDALVEALERCAAFVDLHDPGCADVRDARAALKLAKGEE